MSRFTLADCKQEVCLVADDRVLVTLDFGYSRVICLTFVRELKDGYNFGRAIFMVFGFGQAWHLWGGHQNLQRGSIMLGLHRASQVTAKNNCKRTGGV